MQPSSDTTRPRPGEELDAARIQGFLRQSLPEFAGPSGTLRIRQFPGGASNLTYLLQSGDRELVLRRPPFGTKARTAHDMGREFSVLRNLHAVFPYCPKPLVYCDDPEIVGEPFFLMERQRGVILRRDLPDGFELPPAQAKALCRKLLDVQLELHRIDYQSAGLGDLGRPQGYVKRQVEGWSKRYRASRTDDVPDNAALMSWLLEHMPAESTAASIIHNDYKFDNVVLEERAGEWRVRGVLDWEMATIGDPLMDLGCSLAYWIEAGDPPPMLAARMLPTHLPGMMSRSEVVAYYAAQSGRDVSDFRYYYVFGLFRLAVIVQQIYFRYVRGQTADPRFAGFGPLGTSLARNAEAIAAGTRTL